MITADAMIDLERSERVTVASIAAATKIIIITERFRTEKNAPPELDGTKNSNILHITEVSEIFVLERRWKESVANEPKLFTKNERSLSPALYMKNERNVPTKKYIATRMDANIFLRPRRKTPKNSG